MPTKTTQARRPRAAKAEDAPDISQAEENESSNGDARENTSPSSNEKPDEGSLNLAGLKDMSISELTHIAKEMGIEGATGLVAA